MRLNRLNPANSTKQFELHKNWEWSIPGMHNSRARSGPECVISGPQSRFKTQET